jgi:DNA-binding Lrp family transcriptional regulator
VALQVFRDGDGSQWVTRIQRLTYGIPRGIFHFMRTPPPPLVPLFRSAVQARILEHLGLYRDGPTTIPEIAEAVEAPYQTVYREVRRLAAADLLATDKLGNTTRVWINRASPAAAPLVELLEAVLGIRRHLTQALCGLPGLEAARIFGSWAARYLGTAEGPPPRDVDVLVVADEKLAAREVRRACRQVGQRTNREVNPVIVTASEWEEADSAFLQEVKAGALVELCEDSR